MNRENLVLDRRGLRNFAWMFAGFVAILFGLLLPWLFKHDWPWIPWVIAVVFFGWGLIAPSTVRPFYRVWMCFGFVMNAIVTRIILGIVFYIIILPFGLIFRLRGRDVLHQKWDSKLQSYRVKSSVATSPKNMERPF